MRYLLDTQIALWSLSGVTGEMGSAALAVVSNPENILYLSVASLWEISIKFSKGRLVVPGGTIDDFFALLDKAEMQILPIALDHLNILVRLEDFHKDPFDRLIVAQARSEGMPLVSTDSVMRLYDPALIY